jgi:hypothetical protein
MEREGCLIIDRLWDGKEALAAERAEVGFWLGPAGLRVAIRAGFHGDPAPAAPPGRTDGLWRHEVVELFLANEAGHYLELEFGPHGHYLGLQFSGVRQLREPDPALCYQAEIVGATWQGRAEVALAGLPSGLELANAYAIHGQGLERRYLAAYAVPGLRPDFHQPQRFRPW